MGIIKVSDSKSDFKLTQGHWLSCYLIGHLWFPISYPL